MSGFSSKPASSQSNIFNPSFYQSEGDFITLGTAESLFCKLNDYRLQKAAISISQTDGDSRYIQLGQAISQADGDLRYLQINQPVSYSSASSLILSSGSTSPSNYGLSLNSTLTTPNTTYLSNSIAFCRNSVVSSAIALQVDASSNNQISFFINNGGTLSARMRLSQSMLEAQSLFIYPATQTIGSTSVSNVVFQCNGSPSWLQRAQSSRRYTMLGYIAGGIPVDGVSYDIPSTSLITFNVRADKLLLNTATSTATITGISDGTNLDGTNYDRLLQFTGRGSIPVDFKIILDDRGSATSTGRAAWVGTTQAELWLAANNASNNIVINRLGMVGINNSNPVWSLDVAAVSGGNVTVGAGATSYGWGSRTAYSSFTGPYTVTPACARFQGDIVAASIYTSSDRRMKNDIEPFQFIFMSEFYGTLKPCTFRYKNQTGNARKLGFIAQELLVSSSVPLELLTFQKDEKMKAQSNDDVAGFQLGIDYSAMTVLNAIAIRELINEIKKIKAQLEFTVL